MLKKIFLLALMTIFLFVPKTFAEEIIIFHTNDMHSRILKGDDSGTSIGIAEMTAAVKTVKKNNPNTFWFDAGDTLHGLPRINISNGENIIPILNLSGIDLLIPGNHDYNYGSNQLERLSKKLKFPVLSANTVRKNNGEKIFDEYKIYNLKDGIKIGVFGLTTPETAQSTSPKNVETIEFLNPVESAKKMIEKLRPQCDILVCVMHMGVDKNSEFTSKIIAEETDGIDVIIDGHSHTELPNGLQVKNTLIAQTGCYEHTLGQVKISVENKKITDKQAKLLKASDVKKISEKPDEKVLKAVTDVENRTQKYFKNVVAKTDRSLTSFRLIVRREESELGNLLADAFRWKTGTDIAVVNGGSLREDLPEGNVTRGDILAIQPFGNKLETAEISGKIIREMLEHSVFAYPVSFGGFLNVSGMTFTFDPSKPVGNRVEKIFVNGKPLDENKIYTMATTNFAFLGGDGYDMLKNLKTKSVGIETTDEILTEYLNKVGVKNIELGRIKNLHEMPVPQDEIERAKTHSAKKAA
ncbi:MAG: bifunctional metallophosphatase/5'-nucleotidase [Selenomonadaceae bacterium]|nr:bifunctional metallophosphatase/5'-nucleotidase [Selenomonadaceae bacterium]